MALMRSILYTAENGALEAFYTILQMFWVIIALSEYFIVAAAICRFSVTQNVELEASDNILQISHSLGRNRVSGRFHLKRSKMSF